MTGWQFYRHMTHSRLRSSTVRRGEKLNLSFQLLWIQYCMSLIPTDWARCPFSR
ncbi:hypothetical protein FOXYSP1_08955 [Fusarium oxysporum f. sp. phaseoli]